jgi:hypothetical protein
MQILGLLGLCCIGSFVTNFSLLLGLALAILWHMFKYFAQPFFTLLFHYP